MSAFCRKHNVSRAWFYQVRAAAGKVGSVKALEKKSSAPLTRPTATSPGMNDLLLATRVNGHSEMPVDGLRFCPLVASRTDMTGPKTAVTEQSMGVGQEA
ncbi:MAG: hypothetical protein NVS2B15_05910 [Pseudarthrobacter sp.]